MKRFFLLAATALGLAVIEYPAQAEPTAGETSLAEATRDLSVPTAFVIEGEQFVTEAGKTPYHEKFTLAFDRIAQQLHLSFDGSQGWKRLHVESWGDAHCLEILRADYSHDIALSVQRLSCQPIERLQSELQSGTSVALPAGAALLAQQVRGQSPARLWLPDDTLVASVPEQGAIRLDILLPKKSGPDSYLRWWLSADGRFLARIEKNNKAGKTLERSRYRVVRESVSPSDFEYTPSPLFDALTLKGDSFSYAEVLDTLSRLATNGDPDAKRSFAFWEAASIALAAKPENDSDRRWQALETLAGLGTELDVVTMQARWIKAAIPDTSLPTQFRAMTPAERQAEATRYYWKAAERCESEAAHELSQPLFDKGRQAVESSSSLEALAIMTVLHLTMTRLESIKKQCEVRRQNPAIEEEAYRRFEQAWQLSARLSQPKQ